MRFHKDSWPQMDTSEMGKALKQAVCLGNMVVSYTEAGCNY